MKLVVATLKLLLIFGVTSALAKNEMAPPSKLPMTMGQEGAPLSKKSSSAVPKIPLMTLQEIGSDLPTAQLAKTAKQRFSEVGASTRSAKDAEIYRSISPSVVLILTKDGLGSGSLIGTSGEVITNYHVVKGYTDVAVVFKPTVEGKQPTRDDMKLGHVVKYDEITDLALIKVVEVPRGRNVVRLGDASDIGIGVDVHAIGHPTGEAWTYTTGVISQYRMGYEWIIDKIKHKADIIQTQTPINPGNSGGPLISDAGTLIGINSFKVEGEALNFAISVDDVKKFLARQGNRLAQGSQPSRPKNACVAKEVSRSRNQNNDATIVGYDTNCSGKVNADFIIPDNKTEAYIMRVDRNGDGQADVMYFDFQRRGKWDLSFWDENYDGHWTLVGYHPDGSLTPSRFESYAAFQNRKQAQR
jgi:S1-C subfamily serine protease